MISASSLIAKETSNNDGLLTKRSERFGNDVQEIK